ncbi:phage protein NinX family protein [Pseudomonas sp. NPDC090202]|uniref:phage protein NinX family protein n=1 Tax=Pseudomonas sp. NPDC090202 TaxID=3364476 RepID=UPI003808DFCB
MIKIETGALAGPALRWVLAQIDGVVVGLAPPHYGTGWRVYRLSDGAAYRPDVDWSQGGPLMDKYSKGFGIVESSEPPRFRSFARNNGPEGFCRLSGGPTILIAACRAIVAVHRGDVVQVPEVLAPVEEGDHAAA